MGHRVKWVVIVGVAILVAAGASACGSGTSGLSVETVTYMDTAMPALEKAMGQWQNGNYDAAVKTWKAIGDFPGTTSADQVMSNHYLKYANNVRYYFMQDGSATLKDVEESKTDTESMYAALKAQ